MRLPTTIIFSGMALVICWAGLVACRRKDPEADERVAGARTRALPWLREICGRAGIAYPPGQVFLRAFKRDEVVEVWTRTGTGAEPFRLLTTFAVTAKSGGLGPKRREGDHQVPEGFYAIDLFNPHSNFLLSMRVNYPNASDRILSDREKPGSDIYVHGANVSIGCLPLGDENIERLYVLALDVSQGKAGVIPIHIFPARLGGESWDRLREEFAEKPELLRFWQGLKPGFEAFERTHLVPKVKADAAGGYVIQP